MRGLEGKIRIFLGGRRRPCRGCGCRALCGPGRGRGRSGKERELEVPKCSSSATNCAHPKLSTQASTGCGDLPGTFPAALQRQRLFLVPPLGKGRENLSHSEWQAEGEGLSCESSDLFLWSHRKHCLSTKPPVARSPWTLNLPKQSHKSQKRHGDSGVARFSSELLFSESFLQLLGGLVGHGETSVSVRGEGWGSSDTDVCDVYMRRGLRTRVRSFECFRQFAIEGPESC